MDEKTKQTIERMKQNPAAVQQLLTSPDGQKLIQMMTQSDNGASLQKAANNAMRGNASQLMQMVNQLMQSPEGAELIERINQSARK